MNNNSRVTIVDENAREVTINLDILSSATNYMAILNTDLENGHWNDNPLDISIEKMNVDNKTILKLQLAARGGASISLVPAE